MTAGSNPYERKVIQAITSNKEMREKYSADRIALKALREETVNNLSSLGNAIKILECPIAIAAIEERRDKLEKSLAGIDEREERYIKILAEYDQELKVLRKVCAHPERVFEDHDHHNNVDYHRCVLCGDVS